jgi:hypothetical protein
MGVSALAEQVAELVHGVSMAGDGVVAQFPQLGEWLS